jgi:hypothetical protein
VLPIQTATKKPRHERDTLLDKVMVWVSRKHCEKLGAKPTWFAVPYAGDSTAPATQTGAGVRVADYLLFYVTPSGANGFVMNRATRKELMWIVYQ